MPCLYIRMWFNAIRPSGAVPPEFIIQILVICKITTKNQETRHALSLHSNVVLMQFIIRRSTTGIHNSSPIIHNSDCGYLQIHNP